MNSILIIEDDPASAVLVARMCDHAKFRPRDFRNVTTLEEGIKIVESEPIDLVILDLVLPPSGEAETIRFGIPRLSAKSPVVVLTGSATADVVLQCHAAGAHSCLLKQNVLTEKCGVEKLGQAVGDAILNWRREHAPRN